MKIVLILILIWQICHNQVLLAPGGPNSKVNIYFQSGNTDGKVYLDWQLTFTDATLKSIKIGFKYNVIYRFDQTKSEKAIYNPDDKEDFTFCSQFQGNYVCKDYYKPATGSVSYEDIDPALLPGGSNDVFDSSGTVDSNGKLTYKFKKWINLKTDPYDCIMYNNMNILVYSYSDSFDLTAPPLDNYWKQFDQNVDPTTLTTVNQEMSFADGKVKLFFFELPRNEFNEQQFQVVVLVDSSIKGWVAFGLGMTTPAKIIGDAYVIYKKNGAWTVNEGFNDGIATAPFLNKDSDNSGHDQSEFQCINQANTTVFNVKIVQKQVLYPEADSHDAWDLRFLNLLNQIFVAYHVSDTNWPTSMSFGQTQYFGLNLIEKADTCIYSLQTSSSQPPSSNNNESVDNQKNSTSNDSSISQVSSSGRIVQIITSGVILYFQ